MTLIQVLREIEGVARMQPAIGTVVRQDVYRLNAIRDAHYGVFAWVLDNSATNRDSDTIAYGMTLFYIDRLVAGKSNDTEIQSVGIDVLENILRTLPDEWVIGDYEYEPLVYGFADECAGVSVRLSISVEKGWVCADTFGGEGDFNDDFNNDFYTV